MSVWTVLRAMAGRESGRACRRCGEAIGRRDRFGFGEGVCEACRLDSDR